MCRVRARLEDERKKREEDAKRSALEEARRMPQGISYTMKNCVHYQLRDALSHGDVKVRCDMFIMHSAHILSMPCVNILFVSGVRCVLVVSVEPGDTVVLSSRCRFCVRCAWCV
jgi:hypothetical protein